MSNMQAVSSLASPAADVVLPPLLLLTLLLLWSGYRHAGLGTPCVMNLLGSTFPIILSTDDNHAVMAAARVSAGRAVVFNKENYFMNCDADPTQCSGDSGVMLTQCYSRVFTCRIRHAMHMATTAVQSVLGASRAWLLVALQHQLLTPSFQYSVSRALDDIGDVRVIELPAAYCTMQVHLL